MQGDSIFHCLLSCTLPRTMVLPGKSAATYIPKVLLCAFETKEFKQVSNPQAIAQDGF